jgi:hypothetical protein
LKPKVEKKGKPESRAEQLAKKTEKGQTRKKPLTWEQIQNQVYEKIELYATRFIIFSLVGVVVGVVGLVYGILNMLFLQTHLQDLGVLISVFIGLGAIVVSAILLLWGLFWRGKAESRTII